MYISQLVHICRAPGIEPGNLIRSTLIRYPPGPFLNLIAIWLQAWHNRTLSFKMKSTNLRQFYLWIVVASVGLVCFIMLIMVSSGWHSLFIQSSVQQETRLYSYLVNHHKIRSNTAGINFFASIFIFPLLFCHPLVVGVFTFYLASFV